MPPLPSLNRMSLTRYAAVLVIPLGLILLVTLWIIGQNIQNSVLFENAQRTARENTANLTTRIEERLNSLKQFSRVVARNSLIINGLVDTAERDSYLPTFFRTLDFPAASGTHIWMVDYKGRRIAGNTAGIPLPLDLHTIPAISQLHIMGDMIVSVTPIAFHGSVEGAIIFAIDDTSYPELFAQQNADLLFGLRDSSNGQWLYQSSDQLQAILSADNTAGASAWTTTQATLPDFNLVIEVAQSLKDELQLHETDGMLHLLGLVAYLLVASGLVMLTAHILSRPLVRLCAELSEITALGQLDRRLKLQGPAEIATLAEAFNKMFQRLSDSHTDTQRLNHELREAQKLEAVGQLAGGIAHEINTPAQYVADNLKFIRRTQEDLFSLLENLTAIQATDSADPTAQKVQHILANMDLEFMKEELPLALDESLQGVCQISKIVRAMRDFALPGAKDRLAVDLNRSLDSTLTVTRSVWKDHARVAKDFDSSLPMIKCLPGELNQVFLNLITNASEAIAASGKMADTGLIHVQTERREHNICIHVSDNGIGMDDVTRAHMFEPFFTTKDIGQGLGQGLSVAYDVVVTKHGGSITVNSTRNIGTTITVTLPMVEGSTEQETEHG